MTRGWKSEILPGLLLLKDTCNVFIVRKEEECISIDFGSGEWLDKMGSSIRGTLRHVFLTHHHEDQCHGLAKFAKRNFTVHAPFNENIFLDPSLNSKLTRKNAHIGTGCPPSYSIPRVGIKNLSYDMGEASDFFWNLDRIRFLPTPGHGPNACSILMDIAGKHVLFCGDAAYAGGKIWEPYHLEWDHWTGAGALRAFEGIEKISKIPIDVLCPSHGPIVSGRKNVADTLNKLSEKLLDFYRAKGNISPGIQDSYIPPRKILSSGAKEILPHLYQFGCNGYLLVSESGSSLAVDPFSADMPALEKLMKEFKCDPPSHAVVSHYHFDHCDGIFHLKTEYGTKLVLHPSVAFPLEKSPSLDAPWLLCRIKADNLWPQDGTWKWNEYSFKVSHWPGQTWWHCIFMAQIDGKRVAFGGDSFQPSSRWNGTGGFCAYNRSRFREGFIKSAQKIIRWAPDIMACGHDTYYRFNPDKFREIISWAKFAEKSIRELCPSGDIGKQYFRWKI